MQEPKPKYFQLYHRLQVESLQFSLSCKKGTLYFLDLEKSELQHQGIQNQWHSLDFPQIEVP